MKFAIFSLLFSVSALAQSSVTVNVPVQVVVTPTGTTLSIAAQTITVPVTITTPCGTAPANSTATMACPAGTTGTWTQTTTYTAAASPVCWVPTLTPTSAPAGACTTVVVPPPPPPAANCGMVLGGTVTFCDTFDAPAGTGTRSGDLNGNVWGVSREIGGGTNFGQSQYNQWNATVLQKCDGTTPTVTPPNDIMICNGQLREASNDNNTLVFDAGDVTSLAMYPRQPFDFAGRTGTVSFDVSNDTAGIHAAWPEFWMSDLPVPDPFNHFDSWQSLPANGFGVRFAAAAPIGMQGTCPNANNLTALRWTVDSAVVVRNYVMEDTNGYGLVNLKSTPLDCVIEASGPGQMNHVEMRIAQNQIDVYATDAGVAATNATLKHIAVITSANLTLTRGLIWIEDVHYNADKSGQNRPSQRQHTFTWDNVAFDGPFPGRDFGFDAPDNTAPGQNGSVNLGKLALGGGFSSWSIPGVPAKPNPAAVRILFNFDTGNSSPDPKTLNVTVNGHAHSVPWPYPDQLQATVRTFAVTVPVTDLVTGTNTVLLGAEVALVFSNVDIVLAGVTGAVAVLPGANDAYPGS